jgi:hypothetical protein
MAELQLDIQAHLETVECNVDDHWSVFDPWTGIDSFHNEIIECGDLLNIAADERIQVHKPTPEWYLDLMQERIEYLSTWGPSKLRQAGRDVPTTAAERRREETMDPEVLVAIQAVEVQS